MPISSTEYPATSEGGAVVFDGTSIWTAHELANTITLQQFDPASGAELNSYEIATPDDSDTSGHLTFFNGFLWFVGLGLYVSQIDPASGLLVNQYVIDTTPGDTQQTAQGICHDGTFLYVTYNASDSGMNQKCVCIQMDASTGTINWSTIFSGNNNTFGPVFDGTNLWANFGPPGPGVVELSTAGAILNTIPIVTATDLGELIYSAGKITLLSTTERSLYQVDTGTLALTGPFPLPGSRYPLNLQVDASGNIWVLDLDFGGGTTDFDVFNPITTLIGTLVSDLTDTGAGLAFETISNRMWDAGANGTPVMIAMGFGAGPAGGQFFGTFVGIFGAGHIGGGTK